MTQKQIVNFTNSDWRELCEGLVEAVTESDDYILREGSTVSLVARARAALAQPEPEAVGPTDEELGLIYHDCCRGCEFMDQGGFEDAARAVLARWGHQPAPPAEGEVAELERQLGDMAADAEAADFVSDAAVLTRAADLLEQRHPAPVPVAERLPGPKDCDGKGRCWWGWTTYEGGADRWHWQIDFHDVDYVGGYCCWLPFTALPLPAGEVE